MFVFVVDKQRIIKNLYNQLVVVVLLCILKQYYIYIDLH